MVLVPYRRNDSLAQLFDDFFRAGEPWQAMSPSVYGIRSDVYETPEEVVVEMEAPGLDPERININVTGDTLTVSGDNQKEEKQEGRGYYLQQIRRGSFAQTVSLPAAVESDQAEASFNHGILKITFPKAEEAKPRKIQIKVGKEGK